MQISIEKSNLDYLSLALDCGLRIKITLELCEDGEIDYEFVKEKKDKIRCLVCKSSVGDVLHIFGTCFTKEEFEDIDFRTKDVIKIRYGLLPYYWHSCFGSGLGTEFNKNVLSLDQKWESKKKATSALPSLPMATAVKDENLKYIKKFYNSEMEDFSELLNQLL